MAIEVRVESARADWDAFVAAHPGATAYHAWDWRDVFGPVFGHRPVYLAAREAGQVVGVLPLVAFRSRLFGTFFCSPAALPHLRASGGGSILNISMTLHYRGWPEMAHATAAKGASMR